MHVPLVVAKLAVLTLGLLVSAMAFQGYRRYGRTAMVYLAIGFALISVGTVIEGLLFELADLDIFLASTIQTVIAASGMLVILYSLYGRHTRRVSKDE
ncbi:DUF7521 family protein [Halosolutus halophilus]|uniref:DUF7521 family protein n=1 Tax=Halosolutus halophilus TaxID=1552990 RepID=UPI0022351F44|nr:hypothetical protein [Halosolutus halophilus]